MTPAEEAELLDEVAAFVAEEMSKAFDRYRDLVSGGTAPRDAVTQVMESFRGVYAAELARAFSAILASSVGTASVLAMTVGTVTLSERLYRDAAELSQIVQGIASRHAEGFVDARRLALELYEGYGFKPTEVLKFSRSNDLIPRYLREALLPDLSGDFQTIFARIQVEGLATPALKAAYAQLLEAIETLEDGKGQQLLDNRLRVAFEEKARYLANRIAQTELHRAYAERQAKELMDDRDVEYVRWRLSVTHPRPDICDYFAGVDLYGLGPGVYPKEVAPVPTAHPFCRCILAPSFLFDVTPKPDPDAAGRYFRGLDPDEARQVAGSRAKLQLVLDGNDPMDVHNASKKAAYRMKNVAEAAAEYATRTP